MEWSFLLVKSRQGCSPPPYPLRDSNWILQCPFTASFQKFACLSSTTSTKNPLKILVLPLDHHAALEVSLTPAPGPSTVLNRFGAPTALPCIEKPAGPLSSCKLSVSLPALEDLNMDSARKLSQAPAAPLSHRMPASVLLDALIVVQSTAKPAAPLSQQTPAHSSLANIAIGHLSPLLEFLP